MLSYKARCVTVMLSLVGLLSFGGAVQAQTQHISINTGVLSGLGTYYVEYTLDDGSATANGNSTATIANFQISGGTLGGILAPTSGDVTGVLDSSGILTFVDDGVSSNGSIANTAGTADFAQAFTVTDASSVVSFDLTLGASSIDTLPGPDSFQMQILDGSYAPLATTGPTGAEFLYASYTTATPRLGAFASTDSLYAPAITANVSSAPEPSPLVVVSLGMGGMLILGGYARRKNLPKYV